MPRKPTPAICPICGKQFAQKDRRVQCCSLACGRALRSQHYDARHAVRTCPVCGKQFATASDNRNRICCSPECAKLHRPQTRKANHTPTPRIDLAGQTINGLAALKYLGRNYWEWRCTCGKTFAAKAADVKSGTTRSCGHLSVQRGRDVMTNQRDKISSAQLGSIVSGKLRANNSTGVTGVKVVHNVASVVYVARITVHGKQINLGRYPTLDQAARARKKAEIRYFLPRIKPQK